jgi:DNA primase
VGISDAATLVKESVDIVDVIGQVVPLRRVGNRYVGLCPFHQEKTPSFNVDAEKQFFHCFGCGTGGDVLNFVIKHQNLPFGDALRYLADRYNISLPEREQSYSAKDSQKFREEQNSLYHILNLASEYFYRQLHHSPAGGVARDYLSKRNLPDSVVETQRLGYAPNGWNNLLNHLKKVGVDPELGVKAGLLIKNAKDHVYDRFRHRLIFPITDERNRVAAFGGRSLDGSDPKYLNSPESPVYHKGRMLYQLATAREACREMRQVILVEGYMDLLAFHAQGFFRVVATLGTALTPQQVRLLSHLCDEVVLVYDADDAGQAAMIRALPLFLKEQLSATCLLLPQGMDPDDFLSTGGLPAFDASLHKRQDLGIYAIEKIVAKWDGTISAKGKVLKEIHPIFNATNRSVLRSEYLPLVCERLRLPESAVLRHLHYLNQSSQKTTVPADKVLVTRAPQTRSPEERIVHIMIKYPELIEKVRQSEALKDFQEIQLMTLAQTLLQVPYSSKENFDANVVYDSLSDPELKELFTRFLIEEDTSDGLSFARLRLEDDLRVLRERKTRNIPRDLHEALQEAQQRGDMAQIRTILEQMKNFCSAKEGVKGGENNG